MDRIESINKEIDAIDVQIDLLKGNRRGLLNEKNALLEQRARTDRKAQLEPLPDYTADSFAWSASLREFARQHWQIDHFRPLQLPILNAALDRKRDIFVVLPTGGGKSLCYQLPALIENGFALVVTPLVSLIRDQVFHLEEAGVSAAMLTAASSKEDVARIHNAMTSDDAPYKLIYVTPEKIAKSKRFTAKLTQAYDAGRLSRIIVDEAHCCSQQGHDFRPDYKQLNILRTIFPKTPIMALTATCPWAVMKDVMLILGMKQPFAKEGSLVFSAPLYRPNLVYKVLSKPETLDETLRQMVGWILANYPSSSGIVYCLSKKDTHTIAQGLQKESRGRIRCGVYHADLDDEEKEDIHTLWRRNEIQVIVATIAFGMGINHLKTRFIIHHSLSKSVEGYYQESGRAGRDGEKAECILFYRGQDAARLSSLVVTEVQGRKNLQPMIKYAQDYVTCRKVFFEKYFSFDPSISSIGGGAMGVVNEITPDVPCGVCDNCTRADSDHTTQLVQEDITLEAMTLVRLCRALKQVSEKTTLLKLIQLWQGRGLKAAHIESIRQDADVQIPVDKKYTHQDLERIVNDLIIQGYLGEDFHFTAYSNIAYVVEGYRADTLHKLHKEHLVRGSQALRIQLEFLRSQESGTVAPPTKRRKKAIPKIQEVEQEGSCAMHAIDLDDSS